MSIFKSRSLFVSGMVWTMFTSGASAQQFQYQNGLIPGTPRWTEGVESADVDNDGDLDLFFAEGDGFTSAGAKRQNTLVINQFVGSGSLSFTNESVARLGVHLSNAKGVATGDIDGDGYVDAIFANAFNTDRPFLYINQGAGNAGFFTEDGMARGLTEVLNSAGAGFGDLDDDGDLDLIVCDSGNGFLGGAGDKPVLYINDGSGSFTEKSGSGWNPPNKNSQMDVQLVDVDGDWDLDLVGYCRGANAGGNHYLMINDGSANFTNSSALLPNGSTSCYEAELGDLDGDNDPDIFMVSLSGFREGAVRNNMVENGTLSFTAQSPLSVAQDDNEIALCDYDNDGDLDVAVGSLGTKERMWRNDGGMSFGANSGIIQSVGDSTLDCTWADLDNDGDYDFITAQGESNQAQFVNKVYINSGPADTIAPRLMGELVVSSISNTSGPWVAHAKIQDAVIDDGVNHVSGKVHYVVANNGTSPVVQITAGGFSPAGLNIAAGTTVIFQNTSGSNQSVTSTTAPYTYDSGTLVSGQMFAVAFVRAGNYQFTSTPGGFNGSVTVTGATQVADAEYSGGGIYRGLMNGDASAPGAELFYEFEFTDWAGNALVTTAREIAQPGSNYAAYCFGDGTGAACPCGANGNTGEGCANTGGAGGATLSASGSASFSNDTWQLDVVGIPGNKPGLVLRGNNQVAAPAGDGLLCTAGGSQRSQVQISSGGATTFTNFKGGSFGSVSNSGSATNFQFWYRDPSNPCSGAGFNFTNGMSVTYLP